MVEMGDFQVGVWQGWCFEHFYPALSLPAGPGIDRQPVPPASWTAAATATTDTYRFIEKALQTLLYAHVVLAAYQHVYFTQSKRA